MKRYNVTVNGKTYDVAVAENDSGEPIVTSAAPVAAPAPAPAAPKGKSGSVKIVAPMPGVVMQVKANVGDNVTKGQPIIILEAMKMENDIVAPSDGVVATINVNKGASLNTGDLIATIN